MISMTRTAHSDVDHEEKCFEKIRIRHCVLVEPASPPLVKILTLLVSGLLTPDRIHHPGTWQGMGGGLSSRKEKDVGGESMRGEKEGR